MNWSQALALILGNITLGHHLDPRWNYKIITAVPPYPCSRNRFNGAFGFRVLIGINSSIEIPIDVLRNLFYHSVYLNGRIFNAQVFRQKYLRLYAQNASFVNIVGQIFINSGVAIRVNRTTYQIL